MAVSQRAAWCQPYPMKFLMAVGLAALPWVCLADLPVHCLRHQVEGDWEFIMGPAQPHRTSCGHSRPDSPMAQPKAHFLQSHGPTTSMRMSLQDPAVAMLEDGTTGTWTMIYDEAFEVTVAGTVFLAFSNFEYVMDANKGRTNISHCDSTQIGWYHDAGRSQWGCYYGRKVGSTAVPTGTAAVVNTPQPVVQEQIPLAAAKEMLDAATTKDAIEVGSTAVPTGTAAVVDTPQPAFQEQIPLAAATEMLDAATTKDAIEAAPTSASSAPRKTSLATLDMDQALASIYDDDVAEVKPVSAASQVDEVTAESPTTQPLDTALAAVDVSSMPGDYKPWVPPSAGYDSPMVTAWQQSVADTLNFLQLGWQATTYGIFEGKTPRELNRLAGVRHSRPVPKGGFKSAKTAQLRRSFDSFLGVRSSVRRSSGHTSFDWRQKDGQNWLPPVVTQGDCGSCYTISTVHMLTARNRIEKKSPGEAPFSVNFPLYCSEYNQGCDGGYGFLQSKWSEDVGLVPESCLPFNEATDACHALPDCDMGNTRFRAANHHYVGGYYGASEESVIQEELVNNGPVVMSFEPREDFMYYKSGVYRSGPNKIHQEWEQVDHAVLLIGYGEERGAGYWSLQNSWGNDWGESGFFRMARGIDESGCESIVVAAEVLEESSNPVLDDFLSQL